MRMVTGGICVFRVGGLSRIIVLENVCLLYVGVDFAIGNICGCVTKYGHRHKDSSVVISNLIH